MKISETAQKNITNQEHLSAPYYTSEMKADSRSK